jgi:hypothetical protein
MLATRSSLKRQRQPIEKKKKRLSIGSAFGIYMQFDNNNESGSIKTGDSPHYRPIQPNLNASERPKEGSCTSVGVAPHSAAEQKPLTGKQSSKRPETIGFAESP